VKGIAGKYKNVKAVDFCAGDLKSAKTLVVANYDTPIHNFGNPFNYYPLNGPSSVSASTLPYYTPEIICMLLVLFFIFSYVSKIDFSTRLLFSIIVVTAIFACCILGLIMTFSIGNKINMNRNTSGCVAALRTAQLLDKAKDSTSFVLTDYGCSRHTGDYILHKELPDTIDKTQVICLDCLGTGDTIIIGYQEGHKEEAKALASHIKDAKTQKIELDCLKYTSFSFYPSGLYVTRGFYNSTNNMLAVHHTATNHDDDIDVDVVETICKGIAEYLNTK
jgi:hypothetical protein